MEIGAVLPQTDLGADPESVKHWAVHVEAFGYRHVLLYDHVIGADPVAHKGWDRAFDVSSPFHEPLVTLGFLAGVTGLGLVTGILILPQRQTVLVAKQAAEVDLLSGGRLRLGIGLGWNPVEYRALGQSFDIRARRFEEQVHLLRRLWTERSLDFSGEFDTVEGAGIAPLPQQRPIPLWFGGNSKVAYARAGRLGDGWITDKLQPGPELAEAKAQVEKAAVAADREPSSLGLQGRVRLVDIDFDRRGIDGVVEDVLAWEDAGATHLAIDTMGAGLGGLDEHLDVLRACSERLRLQR
jgi:probable F420-dependent oxidoreductase